KVDEVPVPDEVDLLDAGCAVGDTGTGEQRVDRTTAFGDRGIDRRFVGEIELDGLDAGEGDVREVHDDDLGAGVQRELCGRGAHAGGSADDEHPLAVVPKCVELAHVIFSWALGSRWSGDDAADLEVDNGVPIETEFAENLVAVLVELG